MNPEPDSTADNEAPQEAPAAASAAAPMPSAAETAPTLPGDAADAPDAIPSPSRETSAEASVPAPVPAANAEPSDATPPAASAPAPDLSPAATGARLAELFPALFVGPDGKGTWKPIKLRIHADIQARAPGQFSKRTLGIFFSRYTTTTPYLKALAAPGAQRCDLDGQPAGEIAEEHRSAASEEVARRQAIAAERRAALRKPPAPQRAPAEAEAADGDARPARASRAPREGPPGAERHADAARDRSRRDESAGGGGRQGAPRRPPPGPRRAASHGDAPPRRVAAPDVRSETPALTPALPADPAQRERAMLLRAFESSPLSKANFCVLKRISEAELDVALAQAQAERGGPTKAAAQRGDIGR
jgi:ProP effector